MKLWSSLIRNLWEKVKLELHIEGQAGVGLEEKQRNPNNQPWT